VQDSTGIQRGAVKGARAAAFGGQRTEKSDLLAPGVKLVSAKSMDNALDIQYTVQNENADVVVVVLDFTGSTGIDLVEPVQPSGSLRVSRELPANSKNLVAHVRQSGSSAGALRVSVGVETPNSGRSLPSPAAPARARRNSVEVRCAVGGGGGGG
jgi:hypothetical protein